MFQQAFRRLIMILRKRLVLPSVAALGALFGLFLVKTVQSWALIFASIRKIKRLQFLAVVLSRKPLLVKRKLLSVSLMIHSRRFGPSAKRRFVLARVKNPVLRFLAVSRVTRLRVVILLLSVILLKKLSLLLISKRVFRQMKFTVVLRTRRRVIVTLLISQSGRRRTRKWRILMNRNSLRLVVMRGRF